MQSAIPPVEGEVIRRGSEGYEERRIDIWNRVVPDRYPDVIVTAVSVADVAAVVRYARREHLKLSVRTGGHSWVGLSLRDGGVLLDLSQFDRLDIDADARTARVGPAVRSDTLATELAARGLAFPVGHCGHVPMGGYLLSGGVGLNWAGWKPACFSVRAVEVVTADGEVVLADEQVPGAVVAGPRIGPGFPGVVTRFDIDLHPLPAGTTSSTYVFPLGDAPDVLPWVTSVAPKLGNEVELSTILAGPQLMGMGESLGLTGPSLIVTATAFSNSLAEGAAAVAPLRSCPFAGRASLTLLDAPTPFEEQVNLTGSVLPADHRYATDAQWSRVSTDEVVSALADHFAHSPSGKSVVVTIMPGGAGEGFPRDGAYSMDQRTLTLAYSIWDDPNRDTEHVNWLREAMQRIEPYAAGRFLAESDPQVRSDRVPASFSPENWQRVQQLRKGWQARRLGPAVGANRTCRDPASPTEFLGHHGYMCSSIATMHLVLCPAGPLLHMHP